MYSESCEFVWGAPEAPGGYEWTKCHFFMVSGEGQELWDLGIAAKRGTEFHEYRPLRLGGALYREFARTEPTLPGIRDFANRYGLLTKPGIGDLTPSHLVPKVKRPGGRVEAVASAEPHDLWLHHISWMREILDLWKLADQGNTSQLKDRIRWRQDGSVCYEASREMREGAGGEESPRELRDLGFPEPFMPSAALTLSPQRNLEALTRIRPGDVVKPAMLFLGHLVNVELERNAAPALVFDYMANRWALQVIPSNLLGAMYLQLARSIPTHQIRTCRTCGGAFEVAPGCNRSDRDYCSDPCRSKAYRERQAAARQLRAAGKSLAEIARELGSATATVKAWVGECENQRRKG